MTKLMCALLAATILGGAPAAALAAPTPASAPPTAQAPVKSGHVAAGGVNYYYEVRGKGAPLLLLHGGLGSMDMFGPIMPALTAKHQVITVDLQGHGRTALGERPFGLEAQGADMDAILKQLGYGKVDVLGYSMGGGVAFQLAAQHPERVNRLVLVSAGYAQDGFYADMLKQQAQVGAQAMPFMKDTPMYKSYMAVAPRPQDFPKLLDTLGDYMRKPYDYADQAAKLAPPTLIMFGDSDMYRPEHIVKFYQLLGGGLRDGGWQREGMSKHRLAILPGRTHYDIFLSPEMSRTALAFIEDADKPADWKAD